MMFDMHSNIGTGCTCILMAWHGGHDFKSSVGAYRMCSIEALWADHVGMPACHYILASSTVGYLVLLHSLSVQLFVLNLSDIHCFIASGRAVCNEGCVLCNSVRDG